MKKAKFLIFAVLFTVVYVGFCSCEKEDTNDGNNNSTKEVGVVINGVRWATRNVDAVGTFAATPENYGKFYQWNRKVAYSETGYTVSNWDKTMPEGTTWEKENDPSPVGWRVPTLAEINSLLDENKVSREQTTLNEVNGVRFTDIASKASIFLPAAGNRENDYSYLGNVGEKCEYWSSTKYDSPYGYKQAYYLLHHNYFNSSTELREWRTETRETDYNFGLSVRSVAE